MSAIDRKQTLNPMVQQETTLKCFQSKKQRLYLHFKASRSETGVLILSQCLYSGPHMCVLQPGTGSVLTPGTLRLLPVWKPKQPGGDEAVSAGAGAAAACAF